MQISRRGAAADHGWTVASMKIDRIGWDASKSLLTLNSNKPIPKFAGPGRHIFSVGLSLEEFVETLKTVRDRQSDIGKDKITEALEGAVAALVHLTNVAARSI